MTKSLDSFLHTYKRSITKRNLRRLTAIRDDANKLVNETVAWSRIDENDTITFTSSDLLTDQPKVNDALNTHEKFFLNVTNKHDILKKKIAAFRTGLTKLRNYRHTGELCIALDNIEHDISTKIYRKLHSKRRKDMNTTCILERKISKDKVHNFTTYKPSTNLLQLLSKGPSTIPKEPLPDATKIAFAKQHLTNALKQTIGCTSDKPQLTPMNLQLNKTSLTADDVKNAEDNITFIHDKIASLRNEQAKCTYENPHVMKELQNLSENPDIIANTADKNLGFSLNTTDWYIHEIKRQLSDTSTYIELAGVTEDSILTLNKDNLKKLITDLENVLDASALKPLRDCLDKELKLPSINLLPKVHKLKDSPSTENEKILKGRPIINGHSTTNAAVSKTFDTYMKQINDGLRQLFEHHNLPFPVLKNSDELITEINSLQKLSFEELNRIWIGSLDFESLYTNIKKHHVYQMLRQARDLEILSDKDYFICIQLYNYMQDNNIFHVGFTHFFRQINGLTMGSYDAQDTANNVLLFREFKMMQDPIFRKLSLLYKRYIDDGKNIMVGTPQDVRTLCKLISMYMPQDIEIEHNFRKFKNNYLDLNLKIDHNSYVTGKLSYDIYQKQLNTYSYIHRTSSHPHNIFRGIVHTERTRYARKSSSYLERIHINRLFDIRLRKQGYNTKDITLRKNTTPKPPLDLSQVKIIKIPFYDSHGLNVAVKKMINRSKTIRGKKLLLVNTNKSKLKQLLLTKRKLHNKIGDAL